MTKRRPRRWRCARTRAAGRLTRQAPVLGCRRRGAAFGQDPTTASRPAQGRIWAQDRRIRCERHHAARRDGFTVKCYPRRWLKSYRGHEHASRLPHQHGVSSPNPTASNLSYYFFDLTEVGSSMGIDRVGRRDAPRRRGGTCLEPRRNFAKGCWR
jgi:hypothetical protein